MTCQRSGWLLALVLVLATALRWFQLPERVVWFDEAVSLLLARATTADIVAAARDDTHPPLYNLALRGWLVVVPGERGARALSVVCGVLAVAVVCAIGWRLGGAVAGCLSGALLALCPLHVWYSQEVRMYALQTLFVSASWLLLYVALDRRGWLSWIGYALVSALSLYTQYTSLFALVAQNLYVLAFRRDPAGAGRAWLAAQLAVAGLFAPGVPLALHHYFGRTFGYWLGEFSWADPWRFLALLSGAIQKNPGPYWPWACLSLGLLGVAAAALWRQPRQTVAGLWLWLLTPIVLLAAVSLRANVFLPRTLVFVAPALAVLVGWAAATAGRGGVVAVVLLAGANGVGLSRYYFAANPWVRSALRTVCATVATELQPGDVVLHSSEFSYRPCQFYLDDGIPQGVVRAAHDRPALAGVIGNGQLPPRAAACRRIWLVLWPDFRYPAFHNGVLAWMDAHHTRRRVTHESRQLLVALYERREATLAPPPD